MSPQKSLKSNLKIMGSFIEKTLLNAVTVTTTSAPMNIELFEQVSVQILAASITSGNGVFKIQGTNDGTNWVDLMFIDNLANTNAQNPTRLTSKTLSSNTSAMVFLDETLAVKAIRVVCTVTTDGAYSAFALAKE